MAASILHDHMTSFNRDQKRVRDHKHKWAGGDAEESSGIKKRRPAKHAGAGHKWAQCRCADRDAYCYYCHPHHTFAPKVTKAFKHPSDHLDERFSSVDSDYDLEAEIHASILEADYTYSFDARRGPSEGKEVLGTALDKAVDKYETKATDKLIKSEYEIVGDEKEDVETGPGAMVDDFELI